MATGKPIITIEDHTGYYQVVTGRKYHENETPELMGRYVQEVVGMLEEEADGYMMLGFIREIHTAIDLGKLETFSDLQLSTYNDLFYAAGEVGLNRYQDRQQLLNKKLKRIELHRYLRYVKDVLLCGQDEEYAGTQTYYKFPTITEILANGMDFYFIRYGEATIEALVSKFSTYELLNMMRILAFAAERVFILGPSTAQATKDQVAAMLIDVAESINMDPRTYLTDTAPIVCHKDWDMNNLWLFDPISTMAKLVDYGISVSGVEPLDTLESYHRVIMAQMDNNFWESGYDYLPIQEQVENSVLFTNPDKLVIDVQWPLFFGKGNGGANGEDRFKVFDQAELDTLWNRDMQFTDPSVAGGTFSLRQVMSLLQMKATRPFLRETILRLKGQVIHRDPFDNLANKKVSKTSLLLLFNAGMVLSDMARSMMTVEYREFDIKATRPYVDPTLRYRLREGIFGQLNMLLGLKNMDQIWFVDPRTNAIDVTDLMATMTGILLRLLDCNRFGLFDTISYYANGFMTTANFYMRIFHQQNMVGNQLQFDYTDAKLRNNRAFPGDFQTLGDSGMP